MMDLTPGTVLCLNTVRAVNVKNELFLDPSNDDGWVVLPIGAIVVILAEDLCDVTFYHVLSGVGVCRLSVSLGRGVTVL